MADNVTITSGANSTPPAGTVVATDDVGGVQYQRVKLDVGGDGASTPVTSTGLPINDAGGSLTVDGTVAITAAALPLPTGAATDTLQNAEAVLIGAVTEGAPATDTASSGLNGRLQRIAQRLTSLIALLPASLGQKASAASLAVVVASDQSAIPASQSGTWTVQPGNTANTTAWKVDGSAVTQPVSGTVAATQSGSWTVTESSNAVDGTTTEPSTDLISGWDGQNVRAAYVQNLDGRNTVFVHDPTSRRLLEELLLEARMTNLQLARLLGPQALTQRELDPSARLYN